MSYYVDGFVIPVPKGNIDEYRRIALIAAEVWRDHGALEYCECVGDELDVKDMVPFPKIASCHSDETVVFSWIVFESKEHRDEVNARVMEDPRLSDFMDPAKLPFKIARMAYGGFSTLVHTAFQPVGAA